MDETVTYSVYLNFCGYIGAEEEVFVDAPADASEDDILSLAIDEHASDLLEVTEVADIGDGEWEVTINFCGYIGIDETYTVYADDEDEAIDSAMDDAINDIGMDRYEIEE